MRATGVRVMLAAALAVALLLLLPAGAVGAKTQGCGDLETVGLGIYNVKAKHYKCKKARELANEWEDNQFACVTNGVCTIGLFTCVATPIRSEDHRIVCTNGDKRVTFERRL